MQSISQQQIDKLLEYLKSKGVEHDSLQMEMLDHICCDIENHMSQGLTFDESLKKIKMEIPKNQLKKIQAETMLATHKASKLTIVSMYVGFCSLLLATFFKILKLPGAAELLLSSFVVLAITVTSSVFTSPLIRENRPGRGASIAVLLSILIFICSLCFQMLHLPGGHFLREISVVSLVLILSIYSVYIFWYPQKASGHFIISYVKKYGIGIEKSLFTLFVVGVSLKMWHNDFVSVIYYMMLFSLGGIFYMVKSWQFYLDGQPQKFRKLVFLIVSIVSFSAFLSPTMIRLIQEPARIIMIWGAYTLGTLTVSAYYFIRSDERQRLVLGSLSLLISVLCLANLLAKTLLEDTRSGTHLLNMIYNPFVLGGLLVVFLVFFKRPAFRALLLMVLAIVTFSYQYPGI